MINLRIKISGVELKQRLNCNLGEMLESDKTAAPLAGKPVIPWYDCGCNCMRHLSISLKQNHISKNFRTLICHKINSDNLLPPIELPACVNASNRPGLHNITVL